MDLGRSSDLNCVQSRCRRNLKFCLMTALSMSSPVQKFLVSTIFDIPKAIINCLRFVVFFNEFQTVIPYRHSAGIPDFTET